MVQLLRWLFAGFIDEDAQLAIARTVQRGISRPRVSQRIPVASAHRHVGIILQS